jgi:chaperonin GroEL
MVSNAERMEAVLEDPYILVTDKKIGSIKELLPILEKVVESGKKEMVIIAEEVEGEALTTLIVNKLRGTFNVLAVKAPGFGDRKKEMLQDIAIITGGQFIADELGKKLETIELSDLGHARRVTATKDNTTIVGGKGDKKNISARVAEIKMQITKTDSSFDKEKLQERLGKLAGGVAVIKVGAPTEAAQKELKQRVEDAVAATRAAMEEGIVPGGGIALFNVGLEEMSSTSDAGKAAVAILQHALRAPIMAIVANSGQSDSIVKKLETEKRTKNDAWLGFNAMTNTLGNLKEAGIVDPLKVTKTAFLNALSVASNYLMIGAAVADLPKKDEPAMPGGGMGGGMGMGM